MKKILTLAAIAMTMLLSSCTKEYYTEGDSLNIKTIIGNVSQDAWGYSNLGNNNYFYATISAPEITKDVLHNGVVKVYRVYNFNQSNETHTELPFLLQQEYVDGETGDVIFWTSEVTAEISAGQVTIIYTESDFDYELNETFVPESMVFRIVVMY
ncbi:MAG: hypothetical protein ACI4UJ_02260 [Candidatus Cryptobacteroides sp.]